MNIKNIKNIKKILLLSVIYTLGFSAVKSQVPIGLKNLGATCYMNSVLQNLFQIEPLTNFLQNQGLNYYPENSIGLSYTNLIKEITSGKFKKIIDYGKEFCIPIFTQLGQPKFELGTKKQHDAQEFLTALLSSLSEQKNGHSIPQVLNLINISIKSEIFYESKKDEFKTKSKEETLKVLSLPISVELDSKLKLFNELSECLDEYFSVEELIGENKITVENNVKVVALKNLKLTDTSPYFIISLNRFLFQKGPKGAFVPKKLDQPISFPYKNLDLKKYFDVIFSKQKNYSYNLVGIVQHKGALNSGHYTAYVKSKDQWYFCNDAYVQPIDDSVIEVVANTGIGYDQNESEYQPYILFYKQNTI